MDLFHMLDEEWIEIVRSSAARQRLASWAEESPALRGFDRLDGLIEHVNQRGQSVESDRVLVELARRACLDDLAARTLLQAVMPGMRMLARRYRAIATAAGEDSVGLVVALTFERIRTYPFRRRPGRVAANVLFDVRQRLQRTVGRTRPTIVSLESLVVEPAGMNDDVCTPRALLEEAVAQDVIAARDADLIVLTRLHDHPVAELAAQLNCLPQTLRKRRRRAEMRLQAQM
jgi:hypothetical protein